MATGRGRVSLSHAHPCQKNSSPSPYPNPTGIKVDRGLSQDSIQKELEDELLGFLLEISYVLCFWVLSFLL